MNEWRTQNPPTKTSYSWHASLLFIIASGNDLGNSVFYLWSLQSKSKRDMMTFTEEAFPTLDWQVIPGIHNKSRENVLCENGFAQDLLFSLYSCPLFALHKPYEHITGKSSTERNEQCTYTHTHTHTHTHT